MIMQRTVAVQRGVGYAKEPAAAQTASIAHLNGTASSLGCVDAVADRAALFERAP